MKEHPIIFSTPMVQAILDGRKTMTRRLSGLHEINENTDQWDFLGFGDYGLRFKQKVTGEFVWVKLLYEVGDSLWVRETWSAPRFLGGHYDKNFISYKADTRIPESSGWRPSIFMPRWASRITLEITNIRIERLREITGKDIIKEGAVLRAHDDQFGHNPVSSFDNKVYLDLTSLWAFGWDSINGKKYPWSSNPWVRVIEFARLK